MLIGVDVSKDTLDYCTRDGSPAKLKNSPQPVKRFLDMLAAGTILAMEATGRFHRLLADTAYEMGFTVIVLNPKDVSRYAKSVSPRATTDPISARIIAEFASVRKHRTYNPAPPFAEKLKNLVRTRAGLVKERVAINNRAREHRDIASYLRAAAASIKASIKQLDCQIIKVVQSLPEYQLLKPVPGFGDLTIAYMIALLASGEFRRSDSFVAFIGLDLRVRESGKHKGKRKLSKRGDPEARRLLYMAALTASQQPGPFATLREHYLKLGFSKTEAAVFIARKLARLAWAIYTKHQPYIQHRVLSQHGDTVSAHTTVDCAAPPKIDEHTAKRAHPASKDQAASRQPQHHKTGTPHQQTQPSA